MERPTTEGQVLGDDRQLLAVHCPSSLYPSLLLSPPADPRMDQMLAAIGETLETPFVAPSAENPLPSATPSPTFSNEITGVIVSSRKAFYRINIWTRTSNPGDEERIKNIGKHFKYGVLGLEEGLKISERDKVSSDVEFVSHKDSQAKVGFLLSLSFSTQRAPS
jgi:hypothetical protein